jgi:hypothetical protein
LSEFAHKTSSMSTKKKGLKHKMTGGY